jgi:oligopeptide/dipeptide ABC transporter ATP-binding protein
VRAINTTNTDTAVCPRLSSAADTILEVEDLKKYFPLGGGGFWGRPHYNCAVDGVSFSVRRGETFSLVGESGCGKTTVGRTILRLTPATAGKVYLDGLDLFSVPAKQMRRLRSRLQVIFQDPYASLDPKMRVGDIITEPLMLHGVRSAEERADRLRELLRVVGLQASDGKRYPHEFSGGQRQRIGIARALALKPDLVICDEPVSSLDVSIQSQILNLLEDLQEQFGLTLVFIAHGLHVVKHVSDRVAVMYLGKIVELSPAREIFADPLHPYTKALITAIPVPDPEFRRQRILLQGDVPSSMSPPKGCRFHTRCPEVQERCRIEEPRLRPVGEERTVACHYTARK